MRCKTARSSRLNAMDELEWRSSLAENSPFLYVKRDLTYTVHDCAP